MIRLLALPLIVLGTPFWLTLRRGWGEHFQRSMIAGLILTGAAVAVDAFTGGMLYQQVSKHLDLNLAVALALVVGILALPRAHHQGDLAKQPWSTGTFLIPAIPVLIVDVIVVAGVMFIAHPHWLRDPSHPFAVTLGVTTASYLIVSMLGVIGGGSLPAGMLSPVRSGATRKPYLSTLLRMPRATRDDLSAVFSRRHSALRDIAQQDGAGDTGRPG